MSLSILTTLCYDNRVIYAIKNNLIHPNGYLNGIMG